MSQVLKVFIITILIGIASCSIGGLTYRDPHPPLKPSQGDDPCKPLYWYPKHIPDYCNDPKQVPSPAPVPEPVPMPPLPRMIPMPIPMPMPLPMPPPMMMSMPAYGPPMPAYGPPMPAYGPPMPAYGPPMPANGTPMPAYGPPMPAAYSPQMQTAYGPPMSVGPPAYPSISALNPGPVMQSGFVPGVEGLVTHDGGINILPFSDVYSEYLEKHKQKMIRIRLQELLDRYDNYPKRLRRKFHKQKKYYE